MTTSLVNTVQRQDRCSGTSDSEVCTVGREKDCTANRTTWSGRQTGKCLPPAGNSSDWRCEVAGWCPGEPEDIDPLLINGVDDGDRTGHSPRRFILPGPHAVRLIAVCLRVTGILCNSEDLQEYVVLRQRQRRKRR